MGCHGLDLSGIYLKNSPGKHLAIHRSDWVKIHDLTITAPGDSPNTDGILVQESKHASISSSIIGVGCNMNINSTSLFRNETKIAKADVILTCYHYRRWLCGASNGLLRRQYQLDHMWTWPWHKVRDITCGPGHYIRIWNFLWNIDTIELIIFELYAALEVLELILRLKRFGYPIPTFFRLHLAWGLKLGR